MSIGTMEVHAGWWSLSRVRGVKMEDSTSLPGDDTSDYTKLT